MKGNESIYPPSSDGNDRTSVVRKRRIVKGTVKGFLLLACALAMLSSVSMAEEKSSESGTDNSSQSTLDATRLTMEKWIETQQIIAQERKDWQQGKDILLGRLELVKKEVDSLKEKIKQAETNVNETDKKRKELLVESDQIKGAGDRLKEVVTDMEGQIRPLFTQLPEPVQTKLQPLYQRIPADASTTHVSVAERYQNVLGILNELNKANNEISVSYEVHNLADGKPSEVRAIYIGLAQAYYVSARNEAGIGRPTEEGWKWESSNPCAPQILTALEILQGKQSPIFVPLPVTVK